MSNKDPTTSIIKKKASAQSINQIKANPNRRAFSFPINQVNAQIRPTKQA